MGKRNQITLSIMLVSLVLCDFIAERNCFYFSECPWLCRARFNLFQL